MDPEARKCIGHYVDCMQTKSRYVAFREQDREVRGEASEEEVVVRGEVKLEARPDR